MGEVEKVLAGMGYLILVFLLVTRSREVSQILNTAGNVLTTQTRALQGVDTTGKSSLIGGGNGLNIGLGGLFNYNA